MMDVTTTTWIVALASLLAMAVLMSVQLVAVIRPRGRWTIENVYGGDPASTDPRAYFAVNQGWAWADAVFWGPIQIAGSIGMLLGRRWGFLLALIGATPFWYTAIQIYIWDRDMGIRRPAAGYWILWGVWPVVGVVETVYCIARLA